MKGKILIAESNTKSFEALDHLLRRKDFQCHQIKSIRGLNKHLESEKSDLLIVNSNLGKDELLDIYKKMGGRISSIAIVDSWQTSEAVKVTKLGAFDYITRPFQPEELLSMVEEALLEGKNEKKKVRKEVVGQSPAALLIQKHIKLVAPTEMSVIIQGETGTGKEFVAQEIFHKSRRGRRPFIALDCGAIPKELAGSELFGHKKGSFTGAINDKKGSFELADGGTIFLDEIGNLSYQNQVRLLRVLQEQQIKPIGDTKYKKVNVRVLAATNDDLWQMVQEGAFREDLYHRLNEFKIELPSLSERGVDIEMFAKHFLQKANMALDKEVRGFDKESMALLNSYDWPGNLREMKNVVKRACLMTEGRVIKANALRIGTSPVDANSNSLKLKDVVARAEREAIEKALELSASNKSEAARLLGIDRKTLYNKIETYNSYFPLCSAKSL
ncbi:MAG TPA: sigma-54-dependent Fis family transcriptional regulator [Flavobacteriales bacterium]|nr:sigma-54-dependent Fis family transcriptional regulator [Flavobacteriales bacterium]